MKKNIRMFAMASLLVAGLTNTFAAVSNDTSEDSPIIRQKGDRVFLNLLNADYSPVTVRVTDADNRVVFSEKMKGDFLVTRAFSFEKALSGVYTVEVMDGTSKYRTELTID